MQRRRFLKLAIVGAVAASGGSSAARSREWYVLRCLAAGVRYQRVDPFDLVPGQAVYIRRARHGTELGFEIRNSVGERIGWVPRQHVPVLDSGIVRGAWLSAVRPHAVPWKQVE